MMSELHQDDEPRSRKQKVLTALGYVGATAVLGSAASLGIFNHSSTKTELASTEVTVSPTFDRHITFDNGPIPDARYPINIPLNLGVKLDVGDLTSPPSGTAKDIIAKNAGAVAAQPSGEIRKIKEVLHEQFIDSLVMGFGAGTLPPLLFAAVGRNRRKELLERFKQYHGPTLAVVAMASFISPSSAIATESEPTQHNTPWVEADTLMPELAKYPEAHKLEIRNTAVTSAVRQLVNGLFDSYEQSKIFYSELHEKVPSVVSYH